MMSNKTRVFLWQRMGVVVVFSLLLCVTSCRTNTRTQTGQEAEEIAEQVWTFA